MQDLVKLSLRERVSDCSILEVDVCIELLKTRTVKDIDTLSEN
jgi:hypothetical protein